jgi:cell division protein FtsX
MIPVAILGFLIGAVFAWGFRVWVLIPTTLLMFVVLITYQWNEGGHFLAAVGSGLLVALMPQLGYMFGLLCRTGLLMLRMPRENRPGILITRRRVTGI